MTVFREYRENQQTVILVTHSMENVMTLCGRALMLEDGKIVTIGDVKGVAEAYQNSNQPLTAVVNKAAERKSKKKNITISGNKPTYKMGELMRLTLGWPSDKKVAAVAVSISGINGEFVFGSDTGYLGLIGTSIDYEVKLDLGPGDYYLTAAIKDIDGNTIESYEKIASLAINSDYDSKVAGLVRMKYKYVTPQK